MTDLANVYNFPEAANAGRRKNFDEFVERKSMGNHEMTAEPIGQALGSQAMEFIRLGPNSMGSIQYIPVGGNAGDACIVSASELSEDLKFRLSPEQLKRLDSQPELISAGGMLYDRTFFGFAGGSIMRDGTLVRSEAMIDVPDH